MSSPYNLLFEMMRNYQLALNEMSTMTTGQIPQNLERIHIDYQDQEIQTTDIRIEKNADHLAVQLRSLELMNRIKEFKIENVQVLTNTANQLDYNVKNINADFLNYSNQVDIFKVKLEEMELNLQKMANLEQENKSLKSDLHDMAVQRNKDSSKIKELEGIVADLQHRLKDANESSAHYHKEYKSIESKYSTVKQNSTDGFKNLIGTMDVMKSTIERYQDGFAKINISLQRLRKQVPSSSFGSDVDEDTVDNVLSTIDHLSIQINNLSNLVTPQNTPRKNKVDYELQAIENKYTKMKYHADHVMQFSRQLINSLNLKAPHLHKLKTKLQDFEEQSKMINHQ